MGEPLIGKVLIGGELIGKLLIGESLAGGGQCCGGDSELFGDATQAGFMGGEKGDDFGEQCRIGGAGAQATGIKACEGEEAGAEIGAGGDSGERLQGQNIIGWQGGVFFAEHGHCPRALDGHLPSALGRAAAFEPLTLS